MKVIKASSCKDCKLKQPINYCPCVGRFVDIQVEHKLFHIQCPLKKERIIVTIKSGCAFCDDERVIIKDLDILE